MFDDLGQYFFLAQLYLNGVIYRRKSCTFSKVYVYDRPDDLRYLTYLHFIVMIERRT